MHEKRLRPKASSAFCHPSAAANDDGASDTAADLGDGGAAYVLAPVNGEDPAIAPSYQPGAPKSPRPHVLHDCTSKKILDARTNYISKPCNTINDEEKIRKIDFLCCISSGMWYTNFKEDV